MPRTIVVISLILLLLVSSIGCGPHDWELIDKGILTHIRSTNYCTELTFDNTRVYLLREGIYFANPVILGNYYYLFKEQRGITSYRLDTIGVSQ